MFSEFDQQPLLPQVRAMLDEAKAMVRENEEEIERARHTLVANRKADATMPMPIPPSLPPFSRAI